MDPHSPAARRSTRWVLALTAVGSLMTALDTLVVSTALSTIRLDLGASIEELEWTVNAYNLSFALLVTGLTLQALGLGWIALIAEPGLGFSELVLPFIVAGVGVSMAIPSAQNSVVGAVGIAEVGKAAGTNSMMRELGGVFGIAVLVAVFAGAGSYASSVGFLDGFRPAIAVGAALSLAGAIAGALVPGRAATAADAGLAPARPALESEGGG